MTITNPYILAAIGTGFTFLMTALGAATIFLIRKEMKKGMQSAFLGFAAGVMIAASVWSLLIPSMEQAKELGIPEWLPAGGGFVLGGLFLLALDKALPHLQMCIRDSIHIVIWMQQLFPCNFISAIGNDLIYIHIALCSTSCLPDRKWEVGIQSAA